MTQLPFIHTEQQNSLSQLTWSKLIKTQDGWKCANSEKYPGRNHELFELNAHHLLPKKYAGKNLIQNGITYCRACHAAEHPEYQQKFIDVFRLQTILIKDFLGSWIGLEDEFKYYRLLYYLTGTTTFKPLQKEIIRTIVEEKKHVFVVMPTGVGKSLLYQIPGLLNPDNPSLVISPLKALQKDQVSSLAKKWVPTTYINSELSSTEQEARIKGIIDKVFAFVFIHPRQLLNYDQGNNLVSIKSYKPLTQAHFDYIVVDEAHVVKQQGPSFVKEYYYLDKIRKLYGNAQLILLTATASKKSRELIINKVGLQKDEVVEFVSGFYRPEIKLLVIKCSKYNPSTRTAIQRDDVLFQLLKNEIVGKKIIFASTTDQVDHVHSMLVSTGIKATKYHSKLNSDEKDLNQRQFTRADHEAIDIMVATSAFGLGINIPNIHQIIHYSLPFTLTDYYQQIGRAARSGGTAIAQLIFDEEESTSLIDYINKQTLINETDESIKISMAATYKEEKAALLGYVNSEDKWKYLLNYFGDTKNFKTSNNWFIVLLIFIFLAILIQYPTPLFIFIVGLIMLFIMALPFVLVGWLSTKIN